MARKPRAITVDICGAKWQVYVLSPKCFAENFSDQYAGVATGKNEKMICFRSDELKLATVIHELFHAHFAYLCLGSANLSSVQLEEVFAEYLSDHGEELITQAKRLFKRIIRKPVVKKRV